ncbi:Platinum sensitivity protein, partial [Entomortierella beljakovae]
RATQVTTRVGFYRTLCQCGLFNMFDMALCDDKENSIRMAGIEIMMSTLEHDANLIRSYMVKQQSEGEAKGEGEGEGEGAKGEEEEGGSKQKRRLLDVILDKFLEEKDPGIMIQLSELIRVLLDICPVSDNGISVIVHDIDGVDFLNIFYSHYASKFMTPLVNLSKESEILDRRTSMLCENICNIMPLMVRQHAGRSRSFLRSTGIMEKICLLLKNRDQHLRLVSLKFFRCCAGLNDAYYNGSLLRYKVISHILDILFENGHRNNLLNSVCLEFFEFIRTANIEILLEHVIYFHIDRISTITYTDTFTKLISHYEQQQHHLQQVQQLRRQHSQRDFQVNLDAINNHNKKSEQSNSVSTGDADNQSSNDLHVTPDSSDVHVAQEKSSRPQRRKLSEIEDGDDQGAKGADKLAGLTESTNETTTSRSEKKMKLNTPNLSRESINAWMRNVGFKMRRNGRTYRHSELTISTGDESDNEGPTIETRSSPKSPPGDFTKSKSPTGLAASSSTLPSPTSASSSSSSSPSSSSSSAAATSAAATGSPLPKVATRSGIVFVKASTDPKDINQTATKDAIRLQASIQLKSDLATGSLNHSGEDATTGSTSKRKRDENDVDSGDSTEDRRSGTSRRRIEDNETNFSNSPISDSPLHDSLSTSNDKSPAEEDRIALNSGAATPLRVSAE